MRGFIWQSFLYLVAAGPFGFAFLCAVIQVFGKAWGRFPYRPDDARMSRPYNLPRAHLLCFRYFEGRPLRINRRRRKVNP